MISWVSSVINAATKLASRWRQRTLGRLIHSRKRIIRQDNRLRRWTRDRRVEQGLGPKVEGNSRVEQPGWYSPTKNRKAAKPVWSIKKSRDQGLGLHIILDLIQEINHWIICMAMRLFGNLNRTSNVDVRKMLQPQGKEVGSEKQDNEDNPEKIPSEAWELVSSTVHRSLLSQSNRPHKDKIDLPKVIHIKICLKMDNDKEKR